MSLTKKISASIVEKSFDPKAVLETRKMKFVISTGTKDRGREVINMDNWNLDTYKSNPIVGYQHTLYGGIFTDPNPDYVIGKSQTSIDSFQGKKVIVSEVEFEPKSINKLADKILNKLVFGSLNAASVGILPIGSGKFEKSVYYYDGQELLEWSVVNIPMNGEATKLSMKGLIQQTAEELFGNVKGIDEKMRQMILDAIEKEYGGKVADEVYKEQAITEINKALQGADPNLNTYKARLTKIRK